MDNFKLTFNESLIANPVIDTFNTTPNFNISKSLADFSEKIDKITQCFNHDLYYNISSLNNKYSFKHNWYINKQAWDRSSEIIGKEVCQPLMNFLQENSTDTNVKEIFDFIESVTSPIAKLHLYSHYTKQLYLLGKIDQADSACSRFIELAKGYKRIVLKNIRPPVYSSMINIIDVHREISVLSPYLSTEDIDSIYLKHMLDAVKYFLDNDVYVSALEEMSATLKELGYEIPIKTQNIIDKVTKGKVKHSTEISKSIRKILTNYFFNNPFNVDYKLQLPTSVTLEDYANILPKKYSKRLEKILPSTNFANRFKQLRIFSYLIDNKIDFHESENSIKQLFRKLDEKKEKKIIIDLFNIIPSNEFENYLKNLLIQKEGTVPYVQLSDLQKQIETFLAQGFSPEKNINFYKIALMHTLFSSNSFNSYFPLRQIPVKWLKDYFQFLFFHPNLLHPILEKCFKLEFLDISESGVESANWALLVERLLSSFESPHHSLKPTSAFATAYREAITCELAELKNVPFWTMIEGWGFEKALGRTLLFKNPQGQYRAIKLQSASEQVDALWRELHVVKLLTSEKAKELTSERSPRGLLTTWPTPIDVCRFTNFPSHFHELLTKEIALEDRCVNAYIYEFSDDSYFRYLHDPSLTPEDYKTARVAMLHDLFVLAQHGIVYTALADLFHFTNPTNLALQEARPDEGLFLPLPDLFRVTGQGTGRLRNIWGSIEYPNARASGLADAADVDLIDNIITNIAETPFKERSLIGMQGIESFILAHYAASYLLVDQLILGRREREQMDWQNEDYVKEIGRQMAEGFTIALAAYTNLQEEIVQPFTEFGGLDWTGLARQMSFWMRNDDKGYVPHVQARKIPRNIFENVHVFVSDTKEIGNWKQDRGFMYNEDIPDSGPMSGQHMIKEGERSWYVSALWLVVMSDVQSKYDKWKKRTEMAEDEQETVRGLKKQFKYRPDLETFSKEKEVFKRINPSMN